MTTADPDRVTVALTDMRIAAEQWRQIAAGMAEAAHAAGRLGLSAVELSFIANMLGMVDLYRQTQDRMLALLGEAERAHEWLALALESAAEAYYVYDVDSAHRLRQIS